MDLVFQRKIITVTSVYRPQTGRSEKKKEKFFDDLASELQLRNDNCFVKGDFNSHIGTLANGVHGGFGWGQRNIDKGYLN